MHDIGGQQFLKSGKSKKAKIITISVIGVVAVICLAGYLVINGYLSKIHYDSGKQNIMSSISPDNQSANSDSPKSEIDAMNKKIEENMRNNSKPLMYDKDVYNVLLIGSDTRTKGGTGRSDSMILISINKKTKKIVETSLLRDIYVGIPGVSEGDRLNAAYAYGGPELLLQTVQQNFKIKVDKYICVDFFSFMDLVDKVEGVTINISDAEIEVANGYIHEINKLKNLPSNDGLFTHAGIQQVTGRQALGYVRIRYVGNGDFGRTDRQRTVLNQVFAKIKGLNIGQINNLLNNFLPEVTTNISKGELFSLILSIPAYSKYQVVSWHIPQDGVFSYFAVRKMSVLDVNFEKTISQMQSTIYG